MQNKSQSPQSNAVRAIPSKSYPFKRSIQVMAVLSGLGASAACPAFADLDISSKYTFGVKRFSQVQDQETGQVTDLANTGYLRADLQAVQTLDRSMKLTYGARVEFSRSDELETDLRLSAAYQHNFGVKNSWQIRTTGTLDRAIDDNQKTFQRGRLALRAQKRHSPHHTTNGQIRFGYRDQNEETFDGFDQSEFRTEITHMWRPNRDRMSLSGTFFTESRRADRDQFSYDEVGLRASFRQPFGDATEVTARISYYQRDYRDGFSVSNPDIRNDIRRRASLEAVHKVSAGMSVTASVGWDENTSTISERAFSGATFGLSTTISVN